MDLGSLLQSAGLASLDSVSITSNLNASAPIALTSGGTGGGASQDGGSPSLGRVLAWLQPQVAFGQPGSQIVFAPYGAPSADYGIAALALGAAGLLGVAGLGAAIGRKAAGPFFFAGGVAAVIGWFATRRAS